jgi:invasion protein IalB
MRELATMRGRIFLAAAALLAAFLPVGARAQYVVYNTSHGDWTVTCARTLLNSQVACELDAPKEQLGAPTPARISVAAPAGAGPAVWFRLPGAVDETNPVRLQVDSDPPVEGRTSRYGEGGWDGAAGQALLDAMVRGKKLMIHWWAATGAEGAPRTAAVDLGGFSDALADYRQKLTELGASSLR